MQKQIYKNNKWDENYIKYEYIVNKKIKIQTLRQSYILKDVMCHMYFLRNNYCAF